MAIAYCDINDDLKAVYSQIEQHRGFTTLTGWENTSGSYYKKDQSGYYALLFENGVQFSAGNNSSPEAGEFWYDANTDTMYIQTLGSADPSTVTIEGGRDWDAFKTTCRNDAQEMLEGFLRPIYAVPFQKVITPGESYNSELYDYWIRRATALLTCSIIVQQTNQDDPDGAKLYRQVDNPNQDVEEDPGIVQRIMSGEIVLRTQRSARETGGQNTYEGSSNGATGFMETVLPSGVHSVGSEQVWKVVVDLGGAPGTATYKLSKDDGGTYDVSGQETRKASSDDRRIHLGSGIYVVFTGTLVLNDEWSIHLYPSSDVAAVSQIKSTKLSRN